jgi:hypothetical protein
MMDTNYDWLLLHPAGNHGASLGLPVCRTGTFHLTGGFARANTFQFAGDGVAVALARNLDTTNLLFTATIPSSAAVNPTNLFSGPGAAPFDLTLSLLTGDVLRFIVFSGSNGDNSFDITALTFSAVEDPAPPFALKSALVGGNVVISWPALSNETYEVLGSTDLYHWTSVTQLSSAGASQIFWPVAPSAVFQAFRVELLP